MEGDQRRSWWRRYLFSILLSLYYSNLITNTCITSVTKCLMCTSKDMTKQLWGQWGSNGGRNQEGPQLFGMKLPIIQKSVENAISRSRESAEFPVPSGLYRVVSPAHSIPFPLHKPCATLSTCGHWRRFLALMWNLKFSCLYCFLWSLSIYT